MSAVILKVGGKAYAGWKRIDIVRAVDQASGAFSLEVADLWPGQQTPREIPPGSACQVLIDDTPVITGYVDWVSVAHDSRSHNVTITGRDAALDLVDCTARHATGQWVNQKLDQIARDLAEPFGVRVTVATDVGAAFGDWAIQGVESAWDCIERAARQRAVLIMSDGLGGIVITTASPQRIATPLVLGENILRGGASGEVSQRYAEYTVIGQFAFDGAWDSKTAVDGAGVAQDAAIRSVRKLAIMGEDSQDLDQLQARAGWEAKVRRGRGSEVQITVQGWTHADGLWRPDRMVSVTDEFLRLDRRDLYIKAVRYLLDDREGTRAELTLCPREAFDRIAEPAPELY